MCFPQHFVFVLPAFRNFWYTNVCFDPNYRTAEVASIHTMLARWIWNMAYFRYYYYYGHLLSIIKICNPEETCCYVRPASVIINSNTGSKSPSEHHHVTIRPSSPSTPILQCMTYAWILDVSQLKHGLNKNFRRDYHCQSSQNMCGHIFNYW